MTTARKRREKRKKEVYTIIKIKRRACFEQHPTSAGQFTGAQGI